MCLLCYVSPDATPDWAGLEIACLNNPDGFGWSVHLGDRIITGRSMDAGVALDTYHEALVTHPGSMSMFHARWATHGTTSLDNCHPFYVGQSRHTVIGHNGILPVDVPKGDSRSDTRVFAESVLPQRNLRKMLDTRKGWDKLESWLGGSKLVVFTTKESLKYQSYIVNERLGHWRDGSWWSNDSYMMPMYSMRSAMLMPYQSGSFDLGDGVVDLCGGCGSTLSQDALEIFGYCDSCGACVECGEESRYCLCYMPGRVAWDVESVY